MPEGHTLHRHAHELTEAFADSRLSASSPQGRFVAGAARISGHTFDSADAFGKHLLLRLEDLEDTVHVHLGLYGMLSLTPATGLPVVGAVRLRLESATHTVDLRGPTACALFAPGEVDTLLARLGPDPLRDDADPDKAWSRIGSSRTSIAALLMNQHVLAGVGNVYRAEVLFRLGIDPFLPGRELGRTRWVALWSDLADQMTVGVLTGRIDTIHPQHEPEAMGRPPREDDHGGEVYVYRRAGQACLVCNTPILTQKLAGRNLFWCPSCQQRR